MIETVTTPVRATCGAIALFCGINIAAGETTPGQWSVYENGHFEIFSNAQADDVLFLADDLESFRVAVRHLDIGSVPKDSQKTRIIITRSTEDYPGISRGDSIQAYTTGIDGSPYIVMTARETAEWSRATIRHEFVHVLQGYSGLRIAPWYLEGCAEFLSGMSIDEAGGHLMLGKAIDRKRSRSSMVSWNHLVADEFRFDALGSAVSASTAYYQAGLLVRYLNIADESAYRGRLGEYLARVDEGESSQEIFDRVFGESADELGSRAYRWRNRDIVLDIPLNLDEHEKSPFSHAVVPESEILPILAQLEAANSARLE